MKNLADARSKGLLRFNMILGLLVTTVALFLFITGHYEATEARQSTELVLSWVATAGILYSISFWFACMFRKQLFHDLDHKP